MQLRNAVPILALVLAGACGPQAEPADETNDTTAVMSDAAPANDPAEVQQQIEAANARFKDAIVKGDTATMLANYTDDAVVMGPGEPMARGREALAKAFQGM